MKKLRINVNNKIYDVVVQVLEDDEAQVTGAGYLDPLPLPPQATRPSQPAPVAVPAPAPAGAPARGDVNAIASPIAGTVQKLFVSAGSKVEAKTPVVLLDAMKMDTYIYAPRSGEVAEVCVESNQTVQVGDVLIRYKPEA
jgi:glutaconyl-CoA/methylmalonyl-CoA decarboxylase subunit gamma